MVVNGVAVIGAGRDTAAATAAAAADDDDDDDGGGGAMVFFTMARTPWKTLSSLFGTWQERTPWRNPN